MQYTIALLKYREPEVEQYLMNNNVCAELYTDWLYSKGYVTRIIFDNQEDAIEFKLKFCDNIDYDVM